MAGFVGYSCPRTAVRPCRTGLSWGYFTAGQTGTFRGSINNFFIVPRSLMIFPLSLSRRRVSTSTTDTNGERLVKPAETFSVHGISGDKTNSRCSEIFVYIGFKLNNRGKTSRDIKM